MVKKSIPMTHFAEYLASAKAIQRALGARGPAAADLRQVVADLAALVMALHPEVTRARP